MKKLLLVVLASFAALGMSNATHIKKLCAGMFPKNNLWIGVGLTSAGIDEATFNAALDKVVAVYNPIVQSHGYTLQFNRLWSDGTVNSDTDTEGDSWVINSYGGLARYTGMTSDAYIAVACHELGHHLGGSPLFSDGSGMSVEGEADYHVGTKCLRNVFAADDNVKMMAGAQIDATVLSKCTAAFPGNASEVALCERSAAASFILADILRALGNDPTVAFNTPDPSVVTQTNEDHPAAQCRLDTYFNSGVCTVPASTEFSNDDPSVGGCMTGAGARPACWYAKQ